MLRFGPFRSCRRHPDIPLSSYGNCLKCIGWVPDKENKMSGVRVDLFPCLIHPGVYVTKTEPCHLCAAESKVFRDNQSTRLERLTIALIHAAGDPFKVNCQSVKEIVYLAERFEASLDGNAKAFEEVKPAKPIPEVPWSDQLRSVLDSLGQHAVRCREGGGAEDVLRSITMTCIRMANRLDVCPEPPPDELPVFDDKRVIMTRAQFDSYVSRAIDRAGMWHNSGLTANEMRNRLAVHLEFVVNE